MAFSLHSGQTVDVRPIRPSDKAVLAAGHRALSPETVQRRFLSAKPRLTGSELRYLTEVDGWDHVALIAVLSDQPSEIVGVARFIRSAEDPSVAEAAVVVGDRYQRQGVGKALGLLLADAARERGIRRFTATMLGDNLPAHRLMATISRRLTEGRPEGGVKTLVADIAA